MQIRPEDIVQAGSLDLLAKKAVEGFITGYHKSPFQGYSVEFAEHRPYNVGENTKNIDWKLFARSDKLYNKYFDEETNLRCYFLVDVSSSMQITQDGLLNKLQYAILLSASFMEILKKQRDASSLCFFDEGIKEYTKVSSSSRHYREMLHKMESYLNFSSNKKTTDVSDTIHQIANQIHRRGLVILFTDFFEISGFSTQVFRNINDRFFDGCGRNPVFFIIRFLNRSPTIGFFDCLLHRWCFAVRIHQDSAFGVPRGSPNNL